MWLIALWQHILGSDILFFHQKYYIIPKEYNVEYDRDNRVR